MKKLNKQAFTLVELIVVVAILAVLATVWFVSYSKYLTGVRDTNRVTQLVGIRNAIETFKTTKGTPLPEEKIDIEINGELIGYQWIIGQTILNQIGFTDGWKDPENESYFPYYVTRDKKYFQWMAFLEDDPDIEVEVSFLPQTYAVVDYSIKYPKVIGDPLGILTEKDSNTPLHEIETLTGTLDIATTTDEYTAHFQDNTTISWTGDVLSVIAPSASCKRILDLWKSKWDGVYNINPSWSLSIKAYCDMNENFNLEDNSVSSNTALLSCKDHLEKYWWNYEKDWFYLIDTDWISWPNIPFAVYCDMTTDWWGWTALLRFNPSIHNSTEWWTWPQLEWDLYNYMNYINDFNYNDFYVNKAVWFDWWESVFERVGTDLYARSWPLKDVLIKTSRSWIKSTNLWNWIWFAYWNVWSGFEHWGNEYIYLWHNYAWAHRYDFPFYSLWLPHVSDNPWGWTNYTGDVIAYIFVR